MIYLLDVISTWIYSILFISLGIFVIYVVCSFFKKKSIVVTKLLRIDSEAEKEIAKKAVRNAEKTVSDTETKLAAKDSIEETKQALITSRQELIKAKTYLEKLNEHSGQIITDQYYYLPAASVVITATAQVAVVRSIADDVIQTVKLVGLTLENKVVPEPDTTQLFSLHCNFSAFANDDIHLNINASGLLDSISAIAEDRITQVLAEVSAAPKKILESFVPGRTSECFLPGEKKQPLKTQTIIYTNTFSLTPEELQQTKVKKNWLITIDGIATDTITVDASFECKYNPKRILFLPFDKIVGGVLTRPLYKLKMNVSLTDPSYAQLIIPEYNLMLPDPSVLLHVPIERAFFVRKVQNPKFSNGLLIENYISKPSEAEGFLSIPINALKAVFSIPAQLLNFRISHIRQETELEKAKQGLAKALQDSNAEQKVRENQVLHAKLETEKATLTAQKEILKANNELIDTQKIIIEAKNQIQETWKDIKKEADNNVPEGIIIEAINEKDSEWKALYNVLDISLGNKRVNGIEKNIACLVFRPKEKIKSGQYVPIPETIHFIASDSEEYNIPTDVQETGGEITSTFIEDANESCDSNFPKLPGCSLSRLGNDATGTIGMKVFKNNRSYLLSCYHVLCSPELAQQVFEFDPASAAGSRTVISPGTLDGGNNSNVLGEVIEGKLNEFMDIALAVLHDDLFLNPRICRIDQELSQPVTITLEHVKAKYKVHMSGRTSRFRSAVIKSSYSSTDIDYGFGKKTIKGLIATSSLAQKGDSGAVAFDENCNIIGIIVARSPSNTYVIPISRILTEFKITLK